MNNKNSLKIIIPVFVSFYVMGFVDLVGLATGYVKDDFQLSESLAQLLPFMVFLWFALLSIPTGIIQDRKGKKLTVNAGMLITAIGLLVPFVYYTYATALIGFMILGIGNTILQVSANPLLLDISEKEGKAANLSLSQFIKAGAAMLGPIITGLLVRATGNWKLIFPIYAGISVLSVIWLYSVRIEESKPDKPPANFRSVVALFRKPFVVIMVLSTFLMVGFDVGMNSNIANYLKTKYSVSLESASLGISFYFASLMVGRFLGAVLLRKIKLHGFLLISVVITLIGIAGVILADNIVLARVMIVVAGLGFSNTFPIIFALIVEHMPDYANELSSLIILSVIGGAVIPPIMGVISDNVGVTASMFMLVFCMVYVGFASFYALRSRTEN
jgi:FHS family L-fucose permease-like MFS transporter